MDSRLIVSFTEFYKDTLGYTSTFSINNQKIEKAR